MPVRIPHYKALWGTIDRSLTYFEKDAFNEWRESICKALEQTEKDAQCLAIQANGTPVGEQARKLAKDVQKTRRRFVGTTPPLFKHQ